MAEYKIIEIALIDLCEWSLLPAWLLGGHNKCTQAKPGLAANGWHQYDCNVIWWCILVVTSPAQSGARLAVMSRMSGKQMLLRSCIKYSCDFCDSSRRAEQSAAFISAAPSQSEPGRSLEPKYLTHAEGTVASSEGYWSPIDSFFKLSLNLSPAHRL